MLPRLKALPALGKRYFVSGSLKNDLVAGIVTGSVLVPQSMSYAMLANLPPEIGLYASISLLVYAILGSSKHLSVAPVAMASLLVGMSTAPYKGTEKAVQIAVDIAFISGILQIVLGVTRIGEILTRWLSRTMLTGYTTGVALTIDISQLPAAFGYKVPSSPYPLYTFGVFLSRLAETKPAPIIFFIVCSAVMLISQKIIKPRMKKSRRFIADFATMVVVVVGTATSYALKTNHPEIELAIVGPIPVGINPPALPPLDKFEMSSIGTAFAVALITFFEGFAVAKSLPATSSQGPITALRELIAVGFSNIVSALFGGFNVSGGLSRTMVNVNAGAATQVSSVIAYIVTVFALLLLSPAMKYIPQALLSSIIIVATLGMIKYETLIETYKISKVEFLVSMSTVLMVLAVGPMYGLAYGFGISIVVSLYALAVPHVAELGEMRGGLLRNLKRYPDEAKRIPGVVLVRLDAPLFFANAGLFFTYMKDLIAEREKSGHETVRACIVDSSGMGWIDVSALHDMLKFQNLLASKKCTFIMAEVRGPVRDAIDRFNVATKNNVAPFYERLPSSTGNQLEGLLPVDTTPKIESVSPSQGPVLFAGPPSSPSMEPSGSPGGSPKPAAEITCFSVHSLEEAVQEARHRASPRLGPSVMPVLSLV